MWLAHLLSFPVFASPCDEIATPYSGTRIDKQIASLSLINPGEMIRPGRAVCLYYVRGTWQKGCFGLVCKCEARQDWTRTNATTLWLCKALVKCLQACSLQ